MAHKLPVTLFLVITLWNCDCAPLQTIITNRTGSTSCVGDQVMYTCTLRAFSHTWRIPSLLDVTITRDADTFPDPPDPTAQFSIITTADGGGPNPITTALSVTSFSGLRGANITCYDGNQITIDTQENTENLVFDLPSAPGLTAVPGGDLVSFDFTITPSTPRDCVLNYIITATSSDGTLVDDASEVDGSTTVNRGGFTVCTTNYTFTVAPVTSEGTGPGNASVDAVAPDSGINMVTPNVTLGNSCEPLEVAVSWEPVVGFDDLTVTVGWSAPGGCVCVNSTTVDAAVMRKIVGLNCDYDERSVVFCVQFTAPSGCPSMETITDPKTVNVPDEICSPTSVSSDRGEITVTPAPESGCSLNSAIAVSLTITTVAALLVGFLLGLLAMWCWNKKSAVKTSADTVPPNPVYDEVSHDRGVNMQLTTNEAYGHVK